MLSLIHQKGVVPPWFSINSGDLRGGPLFPSRTFSSVVIAVTVVSREQCAAAHGMQCTRSISSAVDFCSGESTLYDAGSTDAVGDTCSSICFAFRFEWPSESIVVSFTSDLASLRMGRTGVLFCSLIESRNAILRDCLVDYARNVPRPSTAVLEIKTAEKQSLTYLKTSNEK